MIADYHMAISRKVPIVAMYGQALWLYGPLILKSDYCPEPIRLAMVVLNGCVINVMTPYERFKTGTGIDRELTFI